MSLILDALNRADRERGNQQSLASGAGTTQSSSTSALPLRRWALETLVVVAVLVVIYQQSRPIAETAATIAQSAQSGAARPAPAEQQPIARSQSSQTSPLSAALDVAETTPMQANSANTLATALATTGRDPEPATVPITVAIDALYQQPAAPALPVALAPQPAVISPATASDRSLAILSSIPLLAQMPRRLQRAVPTINYTLHIYAQAGGLVELNGQRLKTGAQLSPQLRITAILKDSLVLEFEGVQFRLAALNSWMNFN